MNKFIMTAMSAVWLTGCVSMAPKYDRSEAPVPYTLGAEASQSGQLATALGWQEFVTDPVLSDLIAIALENNRDLRATVLNVKAAEAQYGVTRSNRLPNVAASASYADNERFAEESATDTARQLALGTDSASARLAVTSYELDLFGRVTSLNRAALQTYFATEENARAARLSLIGSVSTAWLNLLANSAYLELAQNTLEAQEESTKLTKAMLDANVIGDLDYQLAITSVEQARADIAQYEIAVRQSLNALQLLLGAPLPANLLEKMDASEPPVRLNIRTGQTSNVLLNRPDVMAAENRLRAANAQIGAARAAFFPQITLTGSAGYSSTDLDDLFTDANGAWSFAPQVSLPIFAGGANRANLKLVKAQRDIALAQYEMTIQSAFKETADALAVAEKIDDQINALQRLVTASERAHYLSQERQKAGVDDYLSVLDAQRTVYSAKQALIAAQTQRAANAVTLYLAVGGGPDL